MTHCCARDDPHEYHGSQPRLDANKDMQERKGVMRCLVTGCAGFIGSHLTDRLLGNGHEVVGVDALTDNYSAALKVRNLSSARHSAKFEFQEADLSTSPLEPLLESIDVVYHLAAQPGVRSSWGTHFRDYTQRNIVATQRLLEAARRRGKLRRFVYASSSSIYGTVSALPVSESMLPRPVSPYGVTKLAGEHLCNLYHASFEVPIVSLRFFTVYGSRQRPDMAFHKFIDALEHGRCITVYDDGKQTRDFTHVSDVVSAAVLAGNAPIAVGRTYNIAGGSRVSVLDSLTCLESVMERELVVEYEPKQAGDVRDTYADIRSAQEDLAYRPVVPLRDGLADEVNWYRAVAAWQAENVRS
jgi:nucleoside-diphosphate-sugar epimerase